MPGRFKVSAIDKAMDKVDSQKLGFSLTQTWAESLVEFLFIHDREETARQIAADMQGTKFIDEEAEKQAFLSAVLRSADQVFRFPVPTVEAQKAMENAEGFQSRQASFKEHYASEKYLKDLKITQNYKKLVSNVCKSLGYQSPEYTLFNQSRRVTEAKNPSAKRFDLDNDVESLNQLAAMALESIQNGENSFSVYKYNSTACPAKLPVPKTWKEKLKNAFKKENLKAAAKEILAPITAIIGVGEGFAPAKFYLPIFTVAMISMGLPVPFAFALAGGVFFAAFSVNALLFYGDSYSTVNNILFKNRLFKDAKGHTLKWYEILRNVFAVVCSAFSAFVIAGLSFYFSGFAVVGAGIVSFMTFLGFFGVLTFAATNIWKLATVSNIINYLKGLFEQPVLELKKAKSWTSRIKNLLVLLVNVTALAAIVVFGISVVAATAGMFFSALSSIPLVTAYLSPLALKVVIGIAELALGTFFVRNVSKFLNVARSTLVNVITSVFSDKQESKVTPKTTNKMRATRETVGRVLGATLVAFAFINASGFAVGYFGTAMSHAAVISALSFGGLVTPLLGVLIIAAPVIAALAYLFSSVGGNAKAGLEAVLAPAPLNPMVKPVDGSAQQPSDNPELSGPSTSVKAGKTVFAYSHVAYNRDGSPSAVFTPAPEKDSVSSAQAVPAACCG